MAQRVFIECKYLLGVGQLNFLTADIRLILCTSATSIFDIAEGASRDLLDFSTLAEYDDPDGSGVSGYTRQTLTGKSFIRQVVPLPGVGKFDAADTIFPALALNAGGDDVDALLWYLHVSDTDDSQNIPLFADNNSPMPYTPDGTDLRFAWGANGIAAIAE